MILPEYKSKLLIALKKTQGTLSKIEKMIENEEYCLKTVQMMSAAQGLLNGAKMKMLENHLQTCGAERLINGSPENLAEFSKEIVKVMDISSRK